MLTLFNLFGKNELQALLLKYNVSPDENRYIIKIKITAVLKHECAL